MSLLARIVEAYDRQMQSQALQQNDARQTAMDQATTMAGQEGSRIQGMDINAGGYNTGQRQQQIAEAMSKRGFSLNEINALISGQQVGMPNMPSFNAAGKAADTQYMQAAQNQYSAAQDQANASNATISGIANVAGSAAMFSDRRLKSNITFIGMLKHLKIYKWIYIWGVPGIGVMSDEVPKEFVIKHSSGYDMVNYSELLGEV